MISSDIGALRKTLKICGSVLVRKVDVSGTSKGGIGGGVCAIKICLTFGLIDRPEERDVCSGCVNVIDSSVLDSQRMTRLGRGWSSSSRTDIGCRISLPGTHDMERPIKEFAVNRALAASRTRGMGATYGTRTTRPNSGGKPKNRSWGGVGWGLLETTVFGIEGKYRSSADGSDIER